MAVPTGIQCIKKQKKGEALKGENCCQNENSLLVLEHSLWRQKFTRVAGIDEAGRGPLAGPVVAAACILPRDFALPGLNDSKKLTPARRERLAGLIKDQAVAWSVARVEAREIDVVNILQGTLQAMGLAVRRLEPCPDALLVDGCHVIVWDQSVPELALKTYASLYQRAVVGGDGLSASIAAASILAKVERDRIMTAWHEIYPAYGFAQHKGYGTQKHLDALGRLGPCPLHRLSFAPVKQAYENISRQDESGKEAK